MSKQMCVWISIASKTGVHHPEVWRCDAARRQMVRGPALTPVAPRPGWRRHCSQLPACRYPSQLLIGFLLTAVMNGVAVSGKSSRGHWDFFWLMAFLLFHLTRCLKQMFTWMRRCEGQSEWQKNNPTRTLLKKPRCCRGQMWFLFSLLFTPSSPRSS